MTFLSRRTSAGLVAILALVFSLLIAAPSQAAKPKTITGTITTETGGPLQADAWDDYGYVEVFRSNNDLYPEGFAWVKKDGTFKLKNLPAGKYKVLFSVTDEVHASQWFGDVPDWDSATVITWNGREMKVGKDNVLPTLDNQLPIGASISGTLSSEDDHPITPGDVDDDGWDEGAWAIAIPATTDADVFDFERVAPVKADGTFTLPGLREGSYVVQFYPGDEYHAPVFWGGSEDRAGAGTITVAKAQVLTGLSQQLHRGATLSGTITGPDGQPIKEAKYGFPSVSVYRVTEFYLYAGYAEVAADGTYTIGGLPAGKYVVEFMPATGTHAPEYWDNQRDEDLADEVTLSRGGAATGINAQLEYASTVSVKAKAKSKGKVDLSITVKANKKAASGQVEIYRGNKLVKTATLNSSGKATVKLTKQPKGKQSFRVVYLGSDAAAPKTKKVSVKVKK